MEQKSTFWKSAMTYGVYLAGISIVWSLIIWAGGLLEKMGLFGSMALGLVNLAIMVTFLLICTKLYRDRVLDGNITFGNAFVLGLMIVVFSTIITGVFSYILNKYIDPEYMGRVVAAMQEKMYQWLSSKGMSQDQIDAAMTKFEQKGVKTPFETVIANIEGGLIGGSIMSLISSAIVKKNKKSDAFEEAMDEIKPEE